MRAAPPLRLYRSVIGWILAGACTLSCSQPSAAEIKAVRAALASYGQALLDEDGKRATRHVDRETIDYYGRMLDAALDGKPADIRAMRPFDKMMVLRIRTSLEPSVVENMTASDLFALGVDKGWIGRTSARRMKIGKVTFTENEARGTIVLDSKRAPISWLFRKEDDRWKLNLTSFLSIANRTLERSVEQQGMSVDDYVVQTLANLNGKKIDDAAWQPMRTK